MSRDSAKTTKGAMLGNLNAAHASQTAMKNASPNSMVGKLATYHAAMTAAIDEATSSKNTADDKSKPSSLTREELTAMAVEQLSAISNKPVTPEVVDVVNALLGIEFTGVPSQADAEEQDKAETETPHDEAVTEAAVDIADPTLAQAD